MPKRFALHQPARKTDENIRYDLLQIQRNIQDVLDPISEQIHLDSILIQDISLTTGATNYINHTLGRSISGWTVHKKNAQADIWEDTSVSVNSSKQLVLQCSANVTCDLVVY